MSNTSPGMEAMAQEAAPSAVAEQASIKSNASLVMPHISDGGAALQSGWCQINSQFTPTPSWSLFN